MDFPEPTKWVEGLLQRLSQTAPTIIVPDGSTLFEPGAEGNTFLVALSGRIRVEQTSPSGRSVVLYRVEAGDSCVMTTSCMLSNMPYSAYGYAEGEVSALAFDRGLFNQFLTEDAAFRGAVFAAFSQRIVELTSVIDDLLLNRVDQKLANWLVTRAAGANRVSATHQSIANELGSAREVMSRILKDFERRGWISLERGAITLIAPSKLEKHARIDVM